MKDDLTDKMSESFEPNGMPIALKVVRLSLHLRARVANAYEAVYRLRQLGRGAAVLGQESNREQERHVG